MSSKGNLEVKAVLEKFSPERFKTYRGSKEEWRNLRLHAERLLEDALTCDFSGVVSNAMKFGTSFFLVERDLGGEDQIRLREARRDLVEVLGEQMRKCAVKEKKK